MRPRRLKNWVTGEAFNRRRPSRSYSNLVWLCAIVLLSQAAEFLFQIRSPSARVVATKTRILLTLLHELSDM